MHCWKLKDSLYSSQYNMLYLSQDLSLSVLCSTSCYVLNGIYEFLHHDFDFN